jgi:membrane protein
VIRNTAVGFFQQAGTRMAAALSYYSIFAGGPVLILTLVLGTIVLGEDATKQAVAQMLQRMLPPGPSGAGDVADQLVRTSTPTASLAAIVGLGSLLGFTRALATSLNVTLRTEGVEPLHRTFLVGPILLIAVLGLLWGAWAFKFLVELVEVSTGGPSGPVEIFISGLAPFILAVLFFATILAVVPRVQLDQPEVLLPAVLGATLWETARHIFGWVVGPDNAYLQIFGPLGGVVALLAWVYVSSVILVLTGQFTWAYAMERRGRGRLAGSAPRQAGLEGWMPLFDGDNAVNEDHAC